MLPVFERLKQEHVILWIDLHEYPPGRDPFEALREELMRARHVVYFVTPTMLRQGRGWTAIEKAYASLIQQKLHFGSYELCHVELPLFFVKPDDPLLTRSIWRSLIDRGRFFSMRPRQRMSRVEWALRQIQQFVVNEQEWGERLAEDIQRDPKLNDHIKDDRNLIDRITAAHPAPIPPKN